MFTGLIEQVGKIIVCQPSEKGLRVTIQSRWDDLVLGESIAVDGMCLTVTNISNQQFNCDISSETLRVTTAGEFVAGKDVNLERALQVGARLGGHFVLGHVDAVCKVAAIQNSGDCIEYHIELLTPEHQRYVLPKGSVCLNGVSLTINKLIPGGFSIMIIPHTQAETNFSQLKIGSHLNIEFDYLIKAVVSHAELEKHHV